MIYNAQKVTLLNLMFRKNSLLQYGIKIGSLLLY